ncbi:hypothetical protein PHISCL_02794 [Aspergillus sclerotialis]|uniref:Uncharacterized protein n=1 Tax=Aspergillus sclerotialis TaxID=2070753 RepID=A0A3A2ZQ55_9EURO|nr:hypothetical protein PHISCL_02794 [Aspergillus sclerotialis]
MSASANKKPYLSNGRMLESPPITVRANRFLENIYLFIGLYLVSFFSFDPYNAAKYSQFNVGHPGNYTNTRPRWGSSGLGGGGGGPSGGGGGGGGGSGGGPWNRRVGRVDDIRGPECGSCQ